MIDYDALVERYRPKGIRIRWKESGWRGSYGILYENVMVSPRPHCRVSLYVFLHECAHFHLRHFFPTDAAGRAFRNAYTGNHQLTLAHQEYQAEMWAMAMMRLEGIPVPRSMLASAKEYVAECLTRPTPWPHDGETPRHVVRWATKRK